MAHAIAACALLHGAIAIGIGAEAARRGGSSQGGDAGGDTDNGKAGSDVTANADEVIVASTAVIDGDLVVRSRNDPTIEEGARISGQVRIEEPREWWIVPNWLLSIGGAVLRMM